MRPFGMILVLAYSVLTACSTAPVSPAPGAPRARIVSPPPVSPASPAMEIGQRYGDSEHRLDLRVERLWTADGLTHASVVVRNTASFDLVKVTVRCLAYGEGESPVGVGETMIFGPEEGRLSPGGSRTTQVSLRAPAVRGMACEARAL